MTKAPLAPLDVRQRYSVIEGCAYLRQSRSKLYNQIKNGTVQIVRDGGRVYLHGAEIARLSRGTEQAA